MSTEASGPRAAHPSALPRGTRLGEFELLHVLGVGGFGIVYLAFDHALEREVAVKEYMPASLVGRTETMHVSLRSQSDAETFTLGLKSFVNEARLLARFDHPSLLKVLRFWEANGTAYMAMPVLRGSTVKEVRREMAQPPDEAWLRALLDPLLGAIERLHSEGVYHRDIAPDNIQIEPDGHPVLLDFGAARRVITDKSQALTAILKPAYAPIEQYAEAGSVKQGPWTDLYALGATVYYVLLGRPPLPATARAVHDDLAPLSGQHLVGCSDDFLHIIDWMLAPRPADRPQSVAALRDVLHGRTPAPLRRAAEPVAPGQWEQTVIMTPAAAAAPGLAHGDDQATMVMPRSPTPTAHALPPPPPPQGRPPSPMPLEPPGPPVPPMPPGAPVPAPKRAAPPPPAGPAGGGGRKTLPMALGLGLGALAIGVAAAVALWPRQRAVLPVEVAASAPAPAASVASAMAAAPIAAVPAASAAEAPALPPATAAPAPVMATPPLAAGPGGAIAAAPRPGDAAPAPAEKKPAAQRPPAAAQPPTTAPGPKPADTRPAPATAGAPPRAVMAPSRAAAVAPEPAPAAAPTAAAQPAESAANGPEAHCAGRNPFSYFVCMERDCLRSEFTSHPDCKKWRRAARQRE